MHAVRSVHEWNLLASLMSVTSQRTSNKAHAPRDFRVGAEQSKRPGTKSFKTLQVLRGDYRKKEQILVMTYDRFRSIPICGDWPRCQKASLKGQPSAADSMAPTWDRVLGACQVPSSRAYLLRYRP